MNKEFIEDFLIFCGHDLKNLQNIDTSINNFLIGLNKNLFEMPTKIGKIEYELFL